MVGARRTGRRRRGEKESEGKESKGRGWLVGRWVGRSASTTEQQQIDCLCAMRSAKSRVEWLNGRIRSGSGVRLA